jgi:hypothetical protein
LRAFRSSMIVGVAYAKSTDGCPAALSSPFDAPWRSEPFLPEASHDQS